MARTTSFALGEDLDRFVRDKVDRGDYASASEVMREALKRMAEQERKERDLMAALDAGMASRRVQPGVWERVEAKVRRARTKR